MTHQTQKAAKRVLRRQAATIAKNAKGTLPSGYQPSKAEMDEDMRIDATPDELAQAVIGRHPRRPSNPHPS